MKFEEETVCMREVVAFLKVTKHTIWVWINDPSSNFPKPYVIGKKYLWKKSEIEAFAESNRKSAQE
jgi:predicted DNA-binding transcriptional regulator AlpA